MLNFPDSPFFMEFRLRNQVVKWQLLIVLLLINTKLSCTTQHENENRSQSITTVSPEASSGLAVGDGGQCTGNCLTSKLTESLIPKCPTLQQAFLNNFLPNGTGDSSVGVTRKFGSASLPDCVSTCCDLDICNFAIVSNASCELFFCTHGVNACMPKSVQTQNQSQIVVDVQLVLVRPPVENKRQNSSCETGAATECNHNEDCFPKNSRARNGYCGCRQEPEPFIFNSQGTCTEIPSEEALESRRRNADVTAIPAVSNPTPPPIKSLEVSVAAKNVTLPEDAVVLYAYAVPESPQDHPYSYEWKLITHPDKDPAVTEGQTTSSLHLTRLIQGTYVFQVTVKSQDATSTGAANVTINVNPAKRTNRVPMVVISPPEQTIQMPTNSAVLDGTSSTDDDKIVSYKWELQKGPINYAFTNEQKNSPTLQINDLVPGNYTFKLTVEDADGATNATTANVTVMKEMDYPPVANAGKDVIIYLPQTEVTLNGNASTDDKKIVLWEWKAVDMQDTHTPYLKLSGLEEGLYQFQLTVTDESGQVSVPSVVHVFVKKPTGNPPKADAGVDQAIALPLTWVILDGSASKADGKIAKWDWAQVSGPNNVTLIGNQEARLNVSGLTKGEYVFLLVIEDDAKLTANDTVNVTVTQKTNEPPKANAGKDFSVTLPASSIVLDGSESTDDVGITEWKWERQGESLTAGNVLDDSDITSKLKLTNLVPGKYIFKLTVKDEQGLSDEDLVSLLVVEDPVKKNLIEVVLGVKLSHLLESDKERFLQKMGLLVHDTRLVFHHVSPQFNSEFSVIYLYGINAKNETREPLELASELRDKLRRDVGLLDFPVESIDTLLCLNPCSGHGTCQDFSTGRECVCDPFWMQSYIKRHFGNGDRNCDWSKIYVGVIACFLLLMKMSIIWSLVFLYRRNARRIRSSFNSKLESSYLNGSVRNGSKRHHSQSAVAGLGITTSSHKNKHYALIEEEDEIELESRGDPSDEDSDSDESLIFERGKEHGSKSVSMSLLRHPTHQPSTSAPTSLPRNGILKKPRQGGGVNT